MKALNDEVLALVFVDLAVILVVAQCAGALATRFGQPRVVGEIAGGLLLGPGLRGLPGPDLSQVLFPIEVQRLLSVLASVAVVFFMFNVGYELGSDSFYKLKRGIVAVSLGSMLIPFSSGIVLGWWLHQHHRFAEERPNGLSFTLFIGIAFTVTALPVLARVIEDLGIGATRPAIVSLASASLNDAFAWLTLAAVTTLLSGGNGLGAIRSGGLFLVFLAAAWWVARPLFIRLADFCVQAPNGHTLALIVVLAGLFLSSWCTTAIGLHAILGAFMFGAMLPRAAMSRAAPQLTVTVEQVTTLFLPVFFVLSALSVELAWDQPGAVELGAIVVLAITGKLAGATAGALIGALTPREAVIVGALMNTRGVTELILLGVGLDMGLLDEGLFASFVAMALITTVMAGPLTRWVSNRGKAARAAVRSRQSE